MTPTAQSPPEPAPPPYPVKRFTIEQYQHLLAAAAFADDDRCELLEGWIIPKMPRNTLHELVMLLATAVLGRAVPPGWHLRAQLSMVTADSQPEPDFAIARGDAYAYEDTHPGPADIALVVEVSDSTLGRDRNLKARLYGRAGIPVYWIINVAERQVEVHTGPDTSGYGARLVVAVGGDLPVVVEGREVARLAVADLLPRPRPDRV